jgi:hydrogenase maturation protease
METVPSDAPRTSCHPLLGEAVSAGKTVVIGCGNLLRGDDAVGPCLIRHLWQLGVPDDVVLVDGGTAGMDVAFKMHGAKQVILIDAAATGAEPGTIYKVPGVEVEQLPPLTGLHSHQFRWDHALAFAHWLLKDDYPRDITVFLIEVVDCTPGAELTPRVDAAMRTVAGHVIGMWEPAGEPC